MRKIGIDFGTTYSSICHVNENSQPGDGGYLQAYKTGQGESLIPSAVAYHKTDPDAYVLVGGEALQMVADPDYDVCQHFKMLLALEGTPELEQFIEKHPDYAMYSHHAPSKVAHDFFLNLLRWYQRDMALDQIDKIVLTMPLVWTGLYQQVHENTGNAQKLLSQALQAAASAASQGKGMTKVDIRSEPEAAAGYFAFLHQFTHGKPFNGQMLVVDHGGGTLDVTLAELSSGEGGIKVASKARSGKGRPLEYALGVAGVAYDRNLAEIALEKASRPLEGNAMTKFLVALEHNKRMPSTRERLNDYHTRGVNKQGMLVEGIQITPSMCKLAFEKANEGPLQEALKEVMEDYPQAKESPNLMVALAGGFSNLPFVEHVVRNCFGAKEDIDDKSDKRFALNTQAARTHAIAMGAALVAAQKVTVEEKLPYEISVWLYVNESKKTEFVPVVLYQTEYVLLQKTVWMPFLVNGGTKDITLGLKKSGRKDVAPRPFRISNLNNGKNRIGSVTTESLVPDLDAFEERNFTIGFSVPVDDEEGISGRHDLLIHFRNAQNGKEKAYPIGEIYFEFDSRLDKV